MLSAYKYRTYPGVIQVAMFAKYFGVCHYRYNWVLKINNGYDRLSSKNLYKRKRPIQTQKRHYTISMLVDDTKVSPEKAQLTKEETIDVGTKHCVLTSQGFVGTYVILVNNKLIHILK
jgi:hypothetical protein